MTGAPTRDYLVDLVAFLRDAATEDERCEYPQSAGRFRAAADVLDAYPLPVAEGEREKLARRLTLNAKLIEDGQFTADVTALMRRAAALLRAPAPPTASGSHRRLTTDRARES